MDASKLKNMIVIKNLPSNIVEEAFIILKPNKKIKVAKNIEKDSNASKKPNSKDYIVREAEMIVSNYLSNFENNKNIKSNTMKQLENKCKKLKIIVAILSTIVIALGMLNI